jgi:hypothetical protein
MGDGLIGLELLDSLFVCLYMFRVDFVLWCSRVKRAKFEEDLDSSLVFCGGQAFGPFSLELNGVLRVLYRERFQFF